MFKSRNKAKTEEMMVSNKPMEPMKCYNCSLTVNISKKKVDGKDEIVYGINAYHPKKSYEPTKEELYSDVESMEEAMEKHIEQMVGELD